jgi:lipopolysaccharide export system protein LptA
MRFIKHNLFLLSMLLLALTSPVISRAETLKKQVENPEPKPIVIKSETMELNNETKIVTFTGAVNAQKDDFVIDCQKMLVFYENKPEKSESEGSENSIDRIVAEGQVKISRTNGLTATSDKAIYYQKTEKAVLTGTPVIKQENDLVEGDRITIFFSENRTLIEGSKQKKVKALIFPKGEKR